MKKALRDVPTGFLGREKQEPWGLIQKGKNEAEASEMGDARGAGREEKKLTPKGSAPVRGAVDCPVPRAVSALESRECPPQPQPFVNRPWGSWGLVSPQDTAGAAEFPPFHFLTASTLPREYDHLHWTDRAAGPRAPGRPAQGE